MAVDAEAEDARVVIAIVPRVVDRGRSADYDVIIEGEGGAAIE